MDGRGIKWRRNIAENFNRLSRTHDRYRRQTDGRQHLANVNVSIHSLKSSRGTTPRRRRGRDRDV